MTSQNTDRLNHLGLSGMATALDRQRGLPAFMGLGFDERLSTLIDAESSAREDRRLERILKLAKLRAQAMPEDIDFRNGRGLDRVMVADLLTCDWVERGRNGIITGPCGTGKTWLTCALGMQAARNEFPVLYHRVSLLLEAMAMAHQDGSISKLRAALAKARLLILDDFGLARSRHEANGIFSKYSMPALATNPPSSPANCRSATGMTTSTSPPSPMPYWIASCIHRSGWNLPARACAG